jgi:hypothetical protein
MLLKQASGGTPVFTRICRLHKSTAGQVVEENKRLRGHKNTGSGKRYLKNCIEPTFVTLLGKYCPVSSGPYRWICVCHC